MNRLQYYSIGQKIAHQAFKYGLSEVSFEKTSWSDLWDILYTHGFVPAFPEYKPEQKRIVPMSVAKALQEAKDGVVISDPEAVLAYAKENILSKKEYRNFVNLLKRQDERSQDPQQKAVYNRAQKDILNSMNQYQAQMELDTQFEVIRGFVVEYAKAKALLSQDSTESTPKFIKNDFDLTIFKEKFLQNTLNLDDIFELMGALDLTLADFAQLMSSLADRAEDYPLVSSLLGLQDEHMELIRIVKDMTHEDSLYFIMALLDALKITHIPVSALMAGKGNPTLSHLEVLEVISEMPDSISSKALLAFLDTEIVKQALNTEARKAGYHGLKAFLETIGDGNAVKGIDSLRSIDREEVEAIMTLNDILTSEFDIDRLKEAHKASSKLKTLSGLTHKVLSEISDTVGLKGAYEAKLKYLINLHTLIGDKTVEDIVFIVKAYQKPMDLNQSVDSDYDSESEGEREEVSSLTAHFETLKRLSKMSDAQADFILDLGLLKGDQIESIRAFTPGLCDQIQSILEDTLKISEADDAKKATFLVLAKISRLTASEKLLLLETSNRLVGTSLPLDWSDPKSIQSIGRISEALYDKIEAIRVAISEISEAEDAKKATLKVLKQIGALSVEEREILIQANNAIFQAELPEGYADSNILKSVSRISDELYDQVESIRQDITELSGLDNRVLGLLRVFRKLHALGKENREILLEANNAIFQAELPVEFADMAVFQGMREISDELFDKILDIVKQASELSESTDKAKGAVELMDSIEGLSSEEKTILKEVYTLINGEDLPPVADEGLYGKVKAIFLDLQALSDSEDKITDVLFIAEKLDQLSEEEKEQARRIVGYLGGDAASEKLNQVLSIVSLTNERNVGIPRLQQYIEARKGPMTAIQAKVERGTTSTWSIVWNVYRGSDRVNTAKDMLIITTILAATVSLLVAGALPYAMMLVGVAVFNVILQLGRDLYGLNNSNNRMNDARGVLNEKCQSVSDAVDFISVLLDNEGNKRDNRNEDMVKAADIMKGVKLGDFGPITHGIAEDVAPEVKQVLSGI